MTSDLYAPLSFIGTLGVQGRPSGTPAWVADVDARRLTAYRILAAYMTNNRRTLDTVSEPLRQNVDGYIARLRDPADGAREYGDAALLVDTARSLVLGEDQTLEFEDQTPDNVRAWFRDWWRAERVPQKLLQSETLSCGLGDSVLVLSPSSGKQRPRLISYDPGVYFPDWTARDDWEDEDFPHTVHLAWGFKTDDGAEWVRRTTWTLHPLDVPRSQPWGGTAGYACFYRIVDYPVDHLREGATVYDPEMGSDAVVVADWTDLLIDFIPVIHVPNTPGVWGQSVLATVAQLLDDLINTDTDLNANKDTTATPDLVVQGEMAEPFQRSGASVIGASGAVGWTDTSKNLTALSEHVDRLLERLSQNTRLADALLGRVKPNEVPSGTALSLGFHPARQLMRDLRLVRNEKFPLILRFAYRIAQAWGWADVGVTPSVIVSLGASLPSDLTTAVETVKTLLPIGGISLEVAVQILADAGLPITDVDTVVNTIRETDWEAAVQLVEAFGNIEYAANRLGMPDPRIIPTPTQIGTE